MSIDYFSLDSLDNISSEQTVSAISSEPVLGN